MAAWRTCGRVTGGPLTKCIACSRNLRWDLPSRRRNEMGKGIGLNDIGREPFRVFFPEAVLAGIIGVCLWPLHFSKLMPLYPGQSHARIMVYGLFGGFIFGFLGTAMP